MKTVVYRKLAQARQGLVPAESLPRKAKHKLIREWHAEGLDDVDMAELSGWSTYTVARIRDGLGLAANEETD